MRATAQIVGVGGACIVAFTIVALAGAVDRPEPSLPSLPRAMTDADFMPVSETKARLGRLLFFDPILSGNRNISCATCHHPDFATSDGVALAIGEGGSGLGPSRTPAIDDNRPEQRIPRNAPALFNLGALEFRSLFHDGRLEHQPDGKGGYRTPLGEDMVEGFETLLAAQTMFPVLSPDEMAGHYGENDVARLARKGEITGADGAWATIARRVAAVPEYAQLFVAAFDAIAAPDDIRFTDVSNALAEFMAFEWRATDSPFDRFLGGDTAALTESEKRGMRLFYGEAGCAACHSGPLQTDHRFHAIAVPQLGPGKVGRFESGHLDIGRQRVTGKAADAYRFRTPSLRNVAATAPYGHSGAYPTLEGIVRHHLDPVASLVSFDPDAVRLPDFSEASASDWAVADDPQEIGRIAAANELAPQKLSEAEIADLIAFLKALTDPASLDGRLGKPERVPSGLPFD